MQGVMAGRHFLQIPGPTNLPDRVLRAIDAPAIDHRGPDFAALGRELLAGLGRILRTASPVVVYPSSGTGAWEAALVNTLSPGDRVLAFETGHFATLWRDMAQRLGLDVEWVPGDWRHGADPDAVADALGRDDSIRAVMIVHNETSTGVTSRLPEISAAMEGHDALLLVDTISSLGSIDYRHDEWGVDVTVGCSQKGLMLPPGLGLNAVSERAFAASERPASRAPTGTGSRSSRPTAPRSGPTRRRRTSSTACARRSRCSRRRASRTCSRATAATPRRRGAPCAAGASRSSARTRASTRRR
jgi:alanine-glyoxylate transaminase / serine-glyoxylate transaminase / serine-pyruvate transaminase